MNKIYITFYLFLFTGFCMAQAPPAAYNNLIKKAEGYSRTNNYKASALAYSQAFKANRGKALDFDRLAAAQAWMMANIPDSAFSQLQKLVSSDKISVSRLIVKDPVFEEFHNQKRWKQLMGILDERIKVCEAAWNRPLMRTLDTIREQDQQLRLGLDSLGKKYGLHGRELGAIWAEIARLDSINLIVVKNILDKQGWLGPDVIGESGNLTLFLVIQHADLNTQVHYLPMLQEAIKQGKARKDYGAMLQDRILVGQGKHQIYGTQIMTDPVSGKSVISPMDDSVHVNQRRGGVGLGPMEDYAREFGIVWKPVRRPKPIINSKIVFTGYHHDCNRAIEIHDSIIGPFNVGMGYGDVMEFSDKIGRFKEENSCWFKFTIPKDTVLTFDIFHSQSDDDLDFVLYRCPSGNCIQDIQTGKLKPARACFVAGFGRNAVVGLSNEVKDTNEINDAYQAGLKVKAGETVYLMINRDYPLRGHDFKPDSMLIYFNGLAPPLVKEKVQTIIRQKAFVLENVFFENGKAALKQESSLTLDKLVTQMKEVPVIRIEIRGHTDNTGTEAANQKLSEDRANAILEYLAAHGVERKRMKAVGLGSSSPIATNETREGRDKNRRVEFAYLRH